MLIEFFKFVDQMLIGHFKFILKFLNSSVSENLSICKIISELNVSVTIEYVVMVA